MIVNANKNLVSKTIHTDICIVGAGGAGIALATEFANTRTNVILVESGGFSVDNKAQNELFDGFVTKGSGHSQTTLSRRRIIGGTTSVWGGRCIPYDNIDFECRDYMPYSGWPISLSDLLPYYKRATPYVMPESLTIAQNHHLE